MINVKIMDSAATGSSPRAATRLSENGKRCHSRNIFYGRLVRLARVFLGVGFCFVPTCSAAI